MKIKLGKRWIEIKYNKLNQKWFYSSLIDGFVLQYNRLFVVAKTK